MIPKITERIMDQRPAEYRAWTALCMGMGVQRYVELGMGGGGAANYMKNAGVPRIAVVELLHTRSEPNVVLRKDIGYISGNSYSESAVIEAIAYLEDSPDVVFVDADHSEYAVRRDFEVWWPVCKMMIAFHDIFMPTITPVWNELSLKISSVQIVGRDYESASIWQDRAPLDGTLPSCGGIGVLFKE